MSQSTQEKAVTKRKTERTPGAELDKDGLPTSFPHFQNREGPLTQAEMTYIQGFVLGIKHKQIEKSDQELATLFNIPIGDLQRALSTELGFAKE